MRSDSARSCRFLASLALTLTVLSLASQTSGQGTAAAPTEPAAQATTPTRPASTRLLDDASARTLGFQPGWQHRLPLRPGGILKNIRVQSGIAPSPSAESVFAWDDDGVILSVEATTGNLRWRSITASTGTGHAVVDVAAAATRSTPLVVALGDATCLMFDARTGAELGRMRYPHVPATPSTRSDVDVVFGARGGHLVWLGFRDEQIPARVRGGAGTKQTDGTDVAAVHCVAYEEFAHRLDGSFSATPIARGDAVIACSTSGQVACFRTSQRACSWSIDLPGGVVTPPALDQERCYVASRDQHLRCIDLASGKTLWKWFSESPLENTPLLAGDLVTLHVQGLGLVAFDTAANAGRMRTPKWKSAAPGDPITRLSEGIVAWDAASHQLSLVDAATGMVRDARTLPDVHAVVASAAQHGELYLMSRDGRVQRCTPTTPPQEKRPASDAAAPETPAASEETQQAPTETMDDSPPSSDPAGT